VPVWLVLADADDWDATVEFEEEPEDPEDVESADVEPCDEGLLE
jgi:hypothetical protein